MRTHAWMKRLSALTLALGAAGATGGPALGQDVEELRHEVEELRLKVEALLEQHEARPPAPLPEARPERRARTDAEYEGLIERLELGMSALRELGKVNEFERVMAIANDVRAERQAARESGDERRGEPGAEREREESEEVRTVRRRLDVMRLAVEAFLEAGDERAAQRVELAMHARELALEGRRDEKAQRIRESAPDRGALAELLAAAAELHRGWGHPDRAGMLLELSRVFAEQADGQRRAEQEGRTSERGAAGTGGLDALGRRVEILRLARGAFAEAGDERAARSLEGAIHYGELALEGAGDEALGRAAQEVPSLGSLVEMLQGAARMYREWGSAERADACTALAELYARRERARSAD